MAKKVPTPMETKGFGWRVSVSILVVFGWAIFFALWLFFYAGGFDLAQNIGVFILSIIIGVAILAAAWAPWGMKYGMKYGKKWEGKESKAKTCNCNEHVWHGSGSAVYGLGFIGALVYFITTAPTFLDAVVGFFKALFWPAFLIYGGLKALGI